MCRRCCVSLALQHPQLPLPKHGCTPRQLLLLLLAHQSAAAREAHLSAVHPSRHGGVLRELAGGGEAGGRPRAVDLAVPPSAGARLRGRRRLQLGRPRRVLHGSPAARGRGRRVELLRGGDVRGEVGDGRGRGDLDLGGEEGVRVGVLRGGDGGRGGELVGLRRRRGGGHGRRIRHGGAVGFRRRWPVGRGRDGRRGGCVGGRGTGSCGGTLTCARSLFGG